VIGAVEALESTLVSVLENRPRDCEILVVHSRPYADPYSLSGEVTFLAASRRASLPQCINQGLEASRSPAVHIVSPDCEVSDGWCDAPLGDLKNPRVASVAPLVYSTLAREKLIAAGVAYSPGGRRTLSVAVGALDSSAPPAILGPALLAGFYRRDELMSIGGFEPSLGALSDVDVAISLRAMGYSSHVEPDSLMYAGPRALEAPRGFSRGLASERLFWRNAPVAGWFKALSRHPWVAMGEMLSELPSPAAVTQLVGRVLACAQPSAYTARHERLRRLASESRPSAPAASKPPRSEMRIDSAHAKTTPAQNAGARAKAG
jgi:hypothetical protein